MRLKSSLMLILVALSVALPAAAQDEHVVYATAQRFEHGLMIWRADTGQIWALADSGSAYNFPASIYSSLPDNPIFGDPPSRLRPIFGFGKVWGNYDHVRSTLGWPTLAELGFNMKVRRAGGTTYLTQLDQSVIQINPNLTWQRTSPPSSPQPAVLGFDFTPDPVLPGQQVTLSWRIQGTEYALIEVWRDGSNAPILVRDYLPATGAWTYKLPDDVAGSIRFVLWGVNRSQHPVLVTLWERVVQSELNVTIWQSPAGEVQTQAAFQQYEQGFMVWRADTGAVMVFGGQTAGSLIIYSEGTYANWPDVPADTDIPPDRVWPVNAFGKVWGYNRVVRNMLGFATGQERSYQATIQTDGSVSTIVSLPDGRRATITGGQWQF